MNIKKGYRVLVVLAVLSSPVLAKVAQPVLMTAEVNIANGVEVSNVLKPNTQTNGPTLGKDAVVATGRIASMDNSNNQYALAWNPDDPGTEEGEGGGYVRSIPGVNHPENKLEFYFIATLSGATPTPLNITNSAGYSWYSLTPLPFQAGKFVDYQIRAYKGYTGLDADDYKLSLVAAVYSN